MNCARGFVDFFGGRQHRVHAQHQPDRGDGQAAARWAQETEETPLQERTNGGMIEDKGGRYIQGPDGKMQGSRPSGRGRVAKGEPRYAPSPQRNKGGIQISAKKYGKLCGIMNTYHPNAESGDKVSIRDVKLTYHVTADGNGGFTVDRITRNKARRR